MLVQETAVEKICASLQQDPFVKAVFLKGSMGRNEHDEHSDVDLYCLVDKEDEEQFLLKRIEHLEAYRSIIFQDDIFIIAPQIIAVYDDLLHIDLFTVTLENFTEKDYFKVLYDPHHLLDNFSETQGLELSEAEYRDAVIDVAWFLFQYKKAAARGNDIWATRMLTNVMEHLARVLLHRYAPNRAQLGLKTISHSLPAAVLTVVEEISKDITPRGHRIAAFRICRLALDESDWIKENLKDGTQAELLLEKMIAFQLDLNKRKSR